MNFPQLYKDLKSLLIQTIRNKLENYHPETENMPFHWRLLGRDRYAMFSFIQSVNTTFGTSLWEQMALIISQASGFEAERQFQLLGTIDPATENLIAQLYRELREGVRDPDKKKEIALIRKSIKKGKAQKDPDSTVDFWVKRDSQEEFFEITSAKPNKKEFESLKLKLLRWTALRLSQNKKAKVMTRIAIPYNPYHPEPYRRWTLKGLYDLKRGEVLVGEEFWDFIAGQEVYQTLLDIFQEAGEELREELDQYFRKFR